MNQSMIFLAVLAHMFLVFFLFIKLGIEKNKAVKLGLVDRKKTALDPKAWPDNVVKLSNNIANQFETPMMFYTLTLMLFLTNNVNMFVVSTATFYVLTRYCHTYFHITTNYVPLRLSSFMVGMVTLLALVVWLMISVIF